MCTSVYECPHLWVCLGAHCAGAWRSKGEREYTVVSLVVSLCLLAVCSQWRDLCEREATFLSLLSSSFPAVNSLGFLLHIESWNISSWKWPIRIIDSNTLLLAGVLKTKKIWTTAFLDDRAFLKLCKYVIQDRYFDFYTRYNKHFLMEMLVSTMTMLHWMWTSQSSWTKLLIVLRKL